MMKPIIYLPLLTILSTGIAFADKNSKRSEALTPEEQLKSFELRDGFVIELVASEEHGLINPIDLTFDDAGRLWTQTAEMYPVDPIPDISFRGAWNMMKDHSLVEKDPRFSKIHRLYTLKDRGIDKILIIDRPDKTAQEPLKAWAEGLTIPQSIMPYKDGCYVAHGSELFFLDDTTKDGVQDSVTTVLSGFGFIDTHTMAHSIVRGPGGWMHFSHGALNSGNVKVLNSGEEFDITYSKNARFSLDGNHLEILNCHRDNNWGYQLRANGQWYATSANDSGYSVLPAEPMSSIPGNGYDNIRPYAPFFPPVHKFRVGGTGISGLAFSEDGSQGFPAEWNNVAILANPITGALNCVRIDRNPSGEVVAEKLDDLLTCSDQWFRPVNIEFGPDGCLYIADWYNKIVSHNGVNRDHPDRDKKHGRIWRVRHQSQKPFKIANVAVAETDRLIQHLTVGKTLWQKRAAWHQIVDRNASELAPRLKEVVLDKALNKDSRILALWSLEGLKQYDKQLLQKVIADGDSDLKREAIRSLATFQASAKDVAELVSPYIEDENCMVRSQILRTLDEINTANSDTIGLLIKASKPAAINNQLGGNYERNFERFLARKALERYNNELVAFLGSDKVKEYPAQNILWSIQALPEQQRVKLFANSFRNSSQNAIDDNTLISISKMLDYPEIREAVAPAFDKQGDKLLQLALDNYDKADTSKLALFYVDQIDELLNSKDPAQVSQGIGLVDKLRSPFHSETILKLMFRNPTSSDSKQLLAVLVHDKEISYEAYKKIFSDQAFETGLRISALAACAIKNHKVALAKAEKFVPTLSPKEKGKLVELFSHTLEGNNIIKSLWEKKLLEAGAWDYNSAYRTRDGNMSNWSATEITNDPWDKNEPRKAKQAAEKDKRAASIYAAAHKIEQQAIAKRKQKISTFIEATENLKGNPTMGKAIFQTCLACHKVGETGQEFAPPLDGGNKRATEHLITAIVNPDDAVEGVYGLYSVVRRDGSYVEGYLIKTDENGALVGLTGGSKVFVARDSILYQGSVNSRSFMPSHFGDLPEQAMVDLVSYIKTLK